jgi:FkbM family methyltransferase
VKPRRTLLRAVRSLLATPGVRDGLRWFIRHPAIPSCWRDNVHRKLAKRARFPYGDSFVHRAASGAELRFLLRGTPTYLFWRGEYEPETTSLFVSLAARARVILDIGTADGVYAILAAAANPDARILAFEPGDVAAETCARNIALNRPRTRNVELHRIALGDRDEDTLLYVAGESGGTSSLDPSFRRSHREQRVRVRRCDSLLSEVGVERVDLVKIDTEATEPAVLAGMRSTMERDKPDLVCEVLAGRTEQSLGAMLAPLGYRYYWVSQRGLVRRNEVVGDKTYRHPNYFFTVRAEAELRDLGAPICDEQSHGAPESL